MNEETVPVVQYTQITPGLQRFHLLAIATKDGT